MPLVLFSALAVFALQFVPSDLPPRSVFATKSAEAATPQIQTATPQYAELVGSSVTAASAGAANTLITLTKDRRILLVVNTLDQDCKLVWAGSDGAFLPAKTSITIDLSTNSYAAANGLVIGIYNLGVTPSASTRVGVSAF